MHRHIPVVLAQLARSKPPFSHSRYEHCRRQQSPLIPYNHLAWARLRLVMLAIKQFDGRSVLHHAAALARLIQGKSFSAV
jgi:hypothetical protein